MIRDISYNIVVCVCLYDAKSRMHGDADPKCIVSRVAFSHLVHLHLTWLLLYRPNLQRYPRVLVKTISCYQLFLAVCSECSTRRQAVNLHCLISWQTDKITNVYPNLLNRQNRVCKPLRQSPDSMYIILQIRKWFAGEMHWLLLICNKITQSS